MKKFRVWDSERQAYRKAGELSFNLDNQTWYFDQANYQDIIIEQSTGLHDCKGVEVFEGDVIKLKYNDPKIVAVEYDNTMGQWIGRLANKTCIRFDYLHLSSEEMREIIGNIHEEGK